MKPQNSSYDLLMLTIISIATVLAIICEWILSQKMRSAVKGSHERYVLATKRRIAAWVQNSLLIVLGLFCLTQDLYFSAALNFIVGYLSIRGERNNDEDDWFTGRGKKIKTAVRDYRKAFAFKPSITTNAA